MRLSRLFPWRLAVASQLSAFLRRDGNTVTREKIFQDKIMFDLKLAAARANVPLQIFTSDVDREGYDIVVDDADLERRFQLKTVLESATTATWYIYKRLLRPQMGHLGFEISPEGVGIEGGVILIRVNDGDDAAPVTYYYTDIYILTAVANGLLTATNPNRANQAMQVIT